MSNANKVVDSKINISGKVAYCKPKGIKPVSYTADIGHYLYKDSLGNLFDAKLSTTKPYGSLAPTLKVNNVEYYIGEGNYEINTKKYEKLSYEPLLFAGICNAFPDQDYIMLDLGLLLPLNQYKVGEPILIDRYEDTTHHVVYNGKPVVIEITTVSVYPEGISAYQYLCDKYYDRINERDVIMIDIGGGTTDICIVRDGVAIQQFSLDVGTIHIYDAIKKSLVDQYIDIKLDVERVRHCIENGFFYEGKEVDLGPAIDSASPIFIQILNELKLNYPITTGVVLLVGGGTEILADSFEEHVADIIVDGDLFANARGALEFLTSEED